ncbi:MAG: regulator of sigma D [Oleispira sp.]|jgi:regulator of sigma D
MLEGCKTAQERWGGVHKLIDGWLNERQNVIVLFFGINTLKPFSPQETPVAIKVQAFCQVLMDYCSAGHFEIYQQLLDEAKQYEDGGTELAKRAYPVLEEITQQFVDFNDKYDNTEHCIEKISDLTKDLSDLGEMLSERFEVEDQLIEKLHNVHRELVAS